MTNTSSDKCSRCIGPEEINGGQVGKTDVGYTMTHRIAGEWVAHDNII
jgi:hypothetical protein